MAGNRDTERVRILKILGLAADQTDEQQRITRSQEFLLMGGSAETHERMQETAIKFEESLEARGKSLAELEVNEAIDLLSDAVERTGQS